MFEDINFMQRRFNFILFGIRILLETIYHMISLI